MDYKSAVKKIKPRCNCNKRFRICVYLDCQTLFNLLTCVWDRYGRADSTAHHQQPRAESERARPLLSPRTQREGIPCRDHPNIFKDLK